MNSALRYNNWGFLLGEVERNIICWLICGLHRSKYMGSARHLQASRLKSRHYKRSHQTQVSMFVTSGTWHTELLEPRSLFQLLGFLITILIPVIFLLIFLFYQADYVEAVFLYVFFTTLKTVKLEVTRWPVKSGLELFCWEYLEISSDGSRTLKRNFRQRSRFPFRSSNREPSE